MVRTKVFLAAALAGLTLAPTAFAQHYPYRPGWVGPGHYEHRHHGPGPGAVVAGVIAGLGVAALAAPLLAPPPPPPPPAYYAPPAAAYYAPPGAGYYYAPPPAYPVAPVPGYGWRGY